MSPDSVSDPSVRCEYPPGPVTVTAADVPAGSPTTASAREPVLGPLGSLPPQAASKARVKGIRRRAANMQVRPEEETHE